MPSNETVRRQRTLGGALGVAVLGCALVYHFFPRVFHVDPADHRATAIDVDGHHAAGIVRAGGYGGGGRQRTGLPAHR